jgi:pSer/pThr/pTyr-binding forkhead associated (FHA) protein
VFSSGEIVDVDRVVVVGRAPDPSRATVGGGARPVPVPSPHQEISSTHVEIRPGSGDGDGVVVVTDLGSTNGTVVVQPGDPAQDLQPGIGVELRPGALIDLGEGQTIQVTTA